MRRGEDVAARGGRMFRLFGGQGGVILTTDGRRYARTIYIP
jgi:hypothetical protein